MRKALSEYYSETENDPQIVYIKAELEATYHERAGPSITLTNAEGDNLVASQSIDNIATHHGQKSPAANEGQTIFKSRWGHCSWG